MQEPPYARPTVTIEDVERENGVTHTVLEDFVWSLGPLSVHLAGIDIEFVHLFILRPQ